MILCDIGNTYFHFYQKGRIWKSKAEHLTELPQNEPLYYISVNPEASKKLQKLVPHAKSLHPCLELDTIYKGLGVDRIAACKAISDGVIIDAGSAITVDVMQNNTHLGGYILPGFGYMSQCLKAISPVLNHGLNMGVDLNAFPQNTRDAISFGVFKPTLLMLKDTCKSYQVHFTGGDGKYLARFFDNAIHDDSLVFKGMQRVIQEKLAPEA